MRKALLVACLLAGAACADVKLGGVTYDKAYLGSTGLSKAYIGGILVFEAAPPAPFAYYMMDDYADDTFDAADSAENPEPAVLSLWPSNCHVGGHVGLGGFVFANDECLTFGAKGMAALSGGDWSLSFLMRRMEDGHAGLLMITSDDIGNWAFIAYYNSALGVLGYLQGPGWLQVDPAEFAFPSEQWFHFVFTYQSASGTVRVYINGDEFDSVSGGAVSGWYACKMFPGDPTGYVPREADDLKVYRRALGAGEIAGMTAAYGLEPYTPPAAPSLYFDAQGGSVDPASIPLTDGQAYSYGNGGYLPIPYQEGLLFGGWYTEPGGSGAYIGDYDYYYGSSDVTLYAYWTL